MDGSDKKTYLGDSAQCSFRDSNLHPIKWSFPGQRGESHRSPTKQPLCQSGFSERLSRSYYTTHILSLRPTQANARGNSPCGPIQLFNRSYGCSSALIRTIQRSATVTETRRAFCRTLCYDVGDDDLFTETHFSSTVSSCQNDVIWIDGA